MESMYTLKVKLNPEFNTDELLIKHYTERPNYLDDSGIDLMVPRDVTCKIGMMNYVNMGISCEMIDKHGNGCAFDLRSRSSISKTPFRLSNGIGTIDRGYRGSIIGAFDVVPYLINLEIRTASFPLNLSGNEITIPKGTRLVQICSPTLEPIKVELVLSLSETQRGDNGFGSTSIKI
jgi:dUTP pyrophosphatase